MLREKYFNYIEEKLSTLAYRIETRGKLNMLSLHVHSENFYLHFFNKLFELNLKNINQLTSNVEAIDLIDEQEGIVIQVSATATKEKIESALEKKSLKDYKGYKFQFISISKEASNLRKKKYENPHELVFSSEEDIYDLPFLLSFINSQSQEFIRSIYDFIESELGTDVNITKLDSNLTHVINILADEDLQNYRPEKKVDAYEINRKIDKNELVVSESIISEYSKFYNKLDAKYEEFDKQGKNKSLSVLSKMNSIYNKLVAENEYDSSDQLFLAILDEVKMAVMNSANYKEFPIDELELCTKIITVDSFIRCKIFEDPNNYEHANT